LASRSADFNYKVALASGLKSLQGGRLRQAEEQFRYLVQHFPAADGGYRGLAKVLVEQEDRPAALRVLLDGGAALAKADQRTSAIALYREAAALDTHDLAAHRRLSAALALSGESDEAAHEYVRYIKAALDANDSDRAKLEAAYALERLPGNAEIAEIARGAGAPIPKAKESPADREELMRTAFGGPAPDAPTSWTAAAPAATERWNAAAPAGADGWAAPAASDGAELEPIAADADALAVEATAARYLAKGDPRGGQAALEAARRYIADGRVDAASDLLLQLIGAGIAEHDAQRLLVDVTRSLGKRDVAKAKVQLLVQALRLDGRTELAAEVEQLAQAF
jgi:thioredoxin-like negative regulator of GroEL